MSGLTPKESAALDKWILGDPPEGRPEPDHCPSCGRWNFEELTYEATQNLSRYICQDCGHEWSFLWD
jgi:hypothetical protein